MVVTENARQGVDKPELLTALWPLLLIGKVFGLIHIQRTGPTEVIYAPKSVYSTSSVILWSSQFILFLFGIRKFLRSLEATDGSLVEELSGLIFHVHVLLTATFSMHQSKKFPDLFQYWSILEGKLCRLESLVELRCCKYFIST